MEKITEAITVPAINAEALIAKGIEKNIPIETMEKLLAMRKELKQEWAREQFFTALAKLQAEIPVIEKTKKVFQKESTTKVRYCYAPLEAIVEQIKPFLQKNGFSYTLKTRQVGADLTIICEAHHSAGHTEATELTVQIDKTAFMTDTQKIGAANSYAKRYAFCNAFGIMTGDEDTDAVEVELKTAPASAPAPAPKGKKEKEVLTDDSEKFKRDEILIHLEKFVPKKNEMNETELLDYRVAGKAKLFSWARLAGFEFVNMKAVTGKSLTDMLMVARADAAGL